LKIDAAVRLLDEATQRLWNATPHRAERVIMSRAPAAARRPGVVVDALEAGVLLRDVLSAAEGLAAAAAQQHDGYGWLWYLRRLPMRVFTSELPTTAPYDAMLATVLSASTARRAHHEARPGQIAYPLDDKAIEPVLWLCGIAIVMAELHGRIRRAGKGQSFLLHPDALPESVSDADLDEAITLYDRRAAADGGFSQTSLVAAVRDSTKTWPLLVAAQAADRQGLPGWTGTLRDARAIQVEGSFVPVFLTLDALAEVTSRAGGKAAGWWEPELPSLIILLRAIALDVLLRSEVAGLNLPATGYLIVPRQIVLRLLDEVLEDMSSDIPEVLPGAEMPASGAAVLTVVERIAGRQWPLAPGPILRAAGDQLVVDLLAANSRLHRMVTIPSKLGGELVNSSASRFETVVQDSIDQSRWKPPEHLAALRRRTLRFDGGNVTDLDAIGTRDGTLLLVSCKNVAYTEEYDAGVYNPVRNARSLVEQAVGEWDQKIQHFRSHPVGGNYDFSRFSRIDGVVVTPHVVFVNSGSLTTTKTIHGKRLLPVASIGELRGFLGSKRMS
jgi:hypothetical protein